MVRTFYSFLSEEKKLNFNYLSEKVYPLFQNLYKLREQNGDPSVVQTFFSHRVGEISRYFFVCGSGEKHPLAPKKQFAAVSLARCHKWAWTRLPYFYCAATGEHSPSFEDVQICNVTQGGMVTLMHRCNSGLISGWLAVASIWNIFEKPGKLFLHQFSTRRNTSKISEHYILPWHSESFVTYSVVKRGFPVSGILLRFWLESLNRLLSGHG